MGHKTAVVKFDPIGVMLSTYLLDLLRLFLVGAGGKGYELKIKG